MFEKCQARETVGQHRGVVERQWREEMRTTRQRVSFDRQRRLFPRPHFIDPLAQVPARRARHSTLSCKCVFERERERGKKRGRIS